MCAKTQPGMHTIVRSGDRLERRCPAIPVIQIARSLSDILLELSLDPDGRVHRRRRPGVGEPQDIGHIRLARIGALGTRGIVEMILAAAGQHGDVGSDLGGLGLEKEMVALRGKGYSLDIACTEAHKTLVGLEFQIDLVSYIPHQAINPVIAIGRKADPAVRLSVGYRYVCAHTQHRYCAYGQRKRSHSVLVSTMPLHG